MDNIRAISALSEGIAPSAPALDIAPDIQATLAAIAANEGLTEPQRAALVDVTVDIAQFISADPGRSDMLSQVAGLGLYFRNTSTNTIPRWAVMTSLRAYGLNLTEKQAQPAPTQPQAVERVTRKLEAIAQSGRNVSVRHAVAVAHNPPPAPKPAPVKPAPVTPQPDTPSPKISKLV